MTVDPEQLRAFEKELDEALSYLPSLSCDGAETLRLAANFYEHAAMEQCYDIASPLMHGIQVLGAHFLSGQTGPTPDAEQLAEDLLFGSTYYTLREYLYYTYNVPGAFSWSFSDTEVAIKFADRSIPRQFFVSLNNWLLGSREAFADDSDTAEVRRLLVKEPEGVVTPNVISASKIIEKEVENKLGAYFSILDPNEDIQLDGFSYADFIAIYRTLLTKALYHRYFAQANDAPGAIFVDRQELIEGLAEETNRSEAICGSVLDEITYMAETAKAKIEPLYFSLYEHKSNGTRTIIVFPHHFAMWEGIVSFLRILALRRPQLFLDRVSGPLGRGFVCRIKSAFERQGFVCRTNLSLARFDSSLPDIDLLVVSEEPTLGYVIFVCEVKGTLPPQWAKDQLRVLNRDSIAKAFDQLSAIIEFLKTGEGIGFIRGQVPEDGLPNFDGFVVVLKSLVITSDNAGMFFSDRDQTIVDFRTLERLLERSDGDMRYILHVLSHFTGWVDEAVKVQTVERRIGKKLVRYEGVTPSAMLDFPQNEWRSGELPQQMLDDFLADGAHPFDVFQGRKAE